MAEIIVGVAATASFVQLIDFGAKLIRRLNQYGSKGGELPKSFQIIQDQLPLLVKAVAEMKTRIDQDSSPESLKKAISPVLTGCQRKLEELDKILAKMPPTSDSWRERGKKALFSLSQETDIKRLITALRDYTMTLVFYNTTAASKVQNTQEELLADVRKWITNITDPEPNYRKALGQRLENTGAWFLNSDRFENWKSEENSILWLHGIPGSGKTILSASILQDIFHCHPGHAITYFYFDFNDPEKQNFANFCRSIFHQLCHQYLAVPKDVESLYNLCKNTSRQPTILELSDTLSAAISEFPGCYIVLDALDECKERQNVVDLVCKLHSLESLPKVHIIITSRKERDIEISLMEFLSQENCLDLDSGVVDEDIRRYAYHCWENRPGFKRWRNNTALRIEVENALMQKAKGMFRWAVCQLDEIAKCINIKQLRTTLARLPKTLDETYERILCGIDELNQEYALRILRWLVFSKRTFTIWQVAELVAIDTDEDAGFDEEEVLPDPQDAVTICSSLITIRDEYVYLAHYSVQEYLLSSRILKGQASFYALESSSANAAIAHGCLLYLQQRICDELLSLYTMRSRFPLAGYSAREWWAHAREVADDQGGKIFTAATKLFANTCGSSNSIRLYHPDLHASPRDSRYNELRSDWSGTEIITNLLYFASCEGVNCIVRKLISDGADINVQFGEFGCPLQGALHFDRTTTFEILFDAGGDVHIRGGKHDTLLQTASFNGYERIVKLLIARQVDVNAHGGRSGSALQAACEKGHSTIAQLLLAAGADVNISWGLPTPLQTAASVGSFEILDKLLAAGADPNGLDYHFHDYILFPAGSALRYASENGSEAMVTRLLNAGADVDQIEGYWDGTALQGAASRDHVSVVQLLLNAGADVNLHIKDRATPLEAAIHINSIEVVQILLSAGADVNPGAECVCSALQAAVLVRSEEITKMLLDAKADINAEIGQNGTALQAAAYTGSEEMMELLLAAGADPTLVGNPSVNPSSPLQEACQQGLDTMVDRLLTAGAALNSHRISKKHEFSTQRLISSIEHDTSGPLVVAAVRGSMSLVEKLLAAGADVNGYGLCPTIGMSMGWATSLYNAVVMGNAAIVERLLAARADPNLPSKDAENWYPLHAAAAMLHFNLVLPLLAAGADPKLGGKRGNTLLHLTISASSIRRWDVYKEVPKLKERLEIIEILLCNGVDINAVEEEWGTALTTATAFNIIPIVEKLIAAGADLNLAGGKRLVETSELDYLGMGHQKIEALLRAADAKEPDVYLTSSEIRILKERVIPGDWGITDHKHW